MMRLDTSGIAGWEDKCVVLEFEHDFERAPGAPRNTHVRLVDAKRRGYDSWVVAFHEFKKGAAR